MNKQQIFKKYVKKLLQKSKNKTKDKNCKGCNYNSTSRQMIIIPAPDKPKIILISRDPTIDFIPIYEYSKKFNNNERRRILFTAGPPHKLIVKIIRFLRKKNKKWDQNLYHKIFRVTYWTHLHKCPTDNENKDTKYKYERAKECANRWLKNEISEWLKDIEKEKNTIHAIICLGKDVENWINKIKEKDKLIKIKLKKLKKLKIVEIIYLPHPSDANNNTWKTQKKKIKKNIKKLNNILKSV